MIVSRMQTDPVPYKIVLTGSSENCIKLSKGILRNQECFLKKLKIFA